MEKSLFWDYRMLKSRAIFCTLVVLAMAACASDPGSNVVFRPSEAQLEQPSQPLSQTAQAVQPASRSSSITAGAKEAISAEQAGEQSSAVPTMKRAPVTRAGSAAYYIPKEMVQDRASLVDLWIDRTTTVEQLKQELAARLQITADKIKIKTVRDKPKRTGAPALARIDVATIPIGDTMIAHLRGGDDFTIDPSGPVTQSLINENRAKWNWRVTPKHASKDGFYLDLDIWIDPGPGKHLIDSYHESVIVIAREKTWYERAQEADRWLVLVGIGGIGGIFTGLLKWYRKRNAA